MYFGGDESQDQVGMLSEKERAIFGKSFAAEPDKLIEQLKGDEAIAEADTLLLTVPNQLGVDYNAHAIESILKYVAPELGWVVDAGDRTAADDAAAERGARRDQELLTLRRELALDVVRRHVREVLLGQHNVGRCSILFEPLATLGAWNRNHCWSLRQHPRQRNLRRAHAVTFCDCGDAVHNRLVGRDRLCTKPRVAAAEITGRNVVGSYRACQEPATQR